MSVGHELLACPSPGRCDAPHWIAAEHITTDLQAVITFANPTPCDCGIECACATNRKDAS